MADPSPSIPHYTPKQETILQGAVQVFLRSGYAGTSMDRVAAEVGVAKQTLYSHFRDKEGLFTALMERMTIRRFQAIFHAPTLTGDPAHLLRQFAEIYLTTIADADYVALIRVIVGESTRFPELAHLYGRVVIQQGRTLLCDYFQRHPELGFSDAEAIAHVFIGSLVSYVLVQEIFGGKEIMPLERERLVNTLMEVLLAQQAVANRDDR